jgi:hypothetical protein
MLQNLTAGDDVRRATADALARMGHPGDAANQLGCLNGPPDQIRRAALLYDAKAWSDAAHAYADLLHDPALTGTARQEAADRYSLALALSQGSPERTLATAPDGLAAHVLAALPPAGADHPVTPAVSVDAVRGALSRAKQIETLLPVTQSGKGY